jgi:NAD(P)-dependent dehydrogenase (short-subunit alcohol dehydrogenase family)
MRLHGKVVVVTGAGRGIGRVIAVRCAREGARVLLAGRSRSSLETTAAQITGVGGDAAVAECDVTVPAAVQALVERTEDVFGPVDVLCANSGVPGPTAPLWEVDPQQWRETFAVNVEGTYLCCRAVLPSMLQRRTGSIVVIGSVTGLRPLPLRTPYAASKTALIGLVRTLAHETGPYGVRVNLVSPGPVAGPRLQEVVRARAAASGAGEDQELARLLAGSALGRAVDAEEVASVVTYLASGDASAVTGEDLRVAAGGYP